MVAFYLPGGVPVYSFSLLIGVGAALGIGWVAWQSTEKERLLHMNASLWALFGAMVGGRATYVSVNWSYYRLHLLEAFQVYQGGLSWPGAMAGGLLLVIVYAWRLRKSSGELLFVLFPLLTSLVFMTWLACWMDGYAYGTLAIRGWGLPALDELGIQAIRLPTQLIGTVSSALWFVVLNSQSARFSRPAMLGWVSLLGVAVILFGLTYLRADPGIYTLRIRLDTWAAFGFGVIALVGLLLSWR